MWLENQKPKIMIFRPSWQEFMNFNEYIAYMESKGAHKAGIAKVCCLCNFLIALKKKKI